MMALEPACLISHQGVCGRVRLVEAVTGELLHDVEDLVSLLRIDGISAGAINKHCALLIHLLLLLFAHRPTQQISTAQAVTRDYLRRLHHLFLINHDAIGVTKHPLQTRMRIVHPLTTVLAVDEIGDEIHRAGTVKRIKCDQVFQPVRLGLHQGIFHAGGLELENRRRIRRLENGVIGGTIVERQSLQVNLNAFNLTYQTHGFVENRQGTQAEKVEFDQAGLFDVVLVKLRDDRVCTGRRIQGAKVGQTARGNEHAAGMHADIPRQTLQLQRKRPEFGDFFFVLDPLTDGRFLVQRFFQRHFKLVRNQFGKLVDKVVAQIQHPPNVTDHSLCGHGAKGHNLRHRMSAIFLLDVVNYPVTAFLAEINIEIGHRYAFRIEESLKQKLVAQGIQIGDAKTVGRKRPGTGATPGTYRYTVFLGPVNEVGHNQKVAGKSHLGNRLDLEIETFGIYRALRLTHKLIRIEQLQPLAQPCVRLAGEELLEGDAVGRRKVRQTALA